MARISFRSIFAGLAALALAVPAAAQITVTQPNYVSPSGTPKSVAPVNIVLPDGSIFAGSSGGGSGGAVTAVSGAFATGSVVDIGAAASPAAGTLNARIEQVRALLAAPLVTGSNIIGRVGIDQTTPGTTNGVVVNSSALPAGASTETTLSGLSSKIPASLGAKTGATSLSVVPNSDTQFPTLNTPSATAAYGIAATTIANASADPLKASAGNVYSVNLVNGTTAGFVVLYDSATTPTGGAALTASLTRYCYPVPASNGFDKAWPIPLGFTAGAQLLFSTSCTSYAIPATLPVILSGQVK